MSLPSPAAEAPPAWATAGAANNMAAAAPTTVDQHEAALFSAYTTLDEPVRETILRDVRAVVAKLKIVLQPMDRALTASYYSPISTTSTDHPEESVSSSSAAGNNDPNNGLPPPPPLAAGTNGTIAGGVGGDVELSEKDRKAIQQLKDWDLWGPLVLCLGLAVLLSIKAPTNQASLVFAAVFCAIWVGGTVVTVNAQLLGGTISFFQSLCVMGYSTFPLVISAFIIGLFKIFVHTWLWVDFLIVLAGFVWSTRVSAVFISLYIKPERRFLALYPVFFFYTFLGWMILLF